MSSSFGGSSKMTYNQPSLQLVDYLNGLDTSKVDDTYKNIANNAHQLSSQLPNYVYNVDGSDAAQQRMESAVYNKAANRLNSQFSTDNANLETRLQNQGLAVGSQAYKNAMGSQQEKQYDALNNAAYDSVMQGQNAFSNSLNNAINAGNFTNGSRQQSLAEILQVLQNSVSGYQVEKDKYGALSNGQVVKSKSGFDFNDAMNLAKTAGSIYMASDARLKKNIKPVGQLDNGLIVYSFNYIDSMVTQIGLIAQEVKEFRPEAVAVDEDGYLQVNYEVACML